MSRILYIEPRSAGWRRALLGAAALTLLAAGWVALSSPDEPSSDTSVAAMNKARPAARSATTQPAPRPGPAAQRALRGTLAVSAPPPEPDDIRERNRGIDIAQLTHTRPSLAETFLREVQLAPNPRGGFVVQAVLPDSRHHKLGLQPGDIVYSIDTPLTSAVDDSSMVALMQQTELELDVYRDGSLLRLRHAYNTDEAPDAAPR